MFTFSQGGATLRGPERISDCTINSEDALVVVILSFYLRVSILIPAPPPPRLPGPRPPFPSPARARERALAPIPKGPPLCSGLRWFLLAGLGGLQGPLGQLGAVIDILAPEPQWEAAAMEMASAIDGRARKWWREQGGFHG